MARLEFMLGSLCGFSTPWIIFDKQCCLEKAASDAQHAADRNDSKEIYSIVRRLDGTTTKPLASIKDENGKLLSDSGEILSCWRMHFQKLVKARITGDLKGCGKPPCNGVYSSLRQWDELVEDALVAGRFVFRPTAKQVWRAIGKLRRDSGFSEDLLSTYILKAGGWELAMIVAEIINDIVRLEYVPIVWRGGKLVVVYKGKGSANVPDN